MLGRMKIAARRPDRRRDHEARERAYYQLALARRAVDLITDGVAPCHAQNQIAGFTLGRLRLIGLDGDEIGGISRDQYDAGIQWADICDRHARIMGYAPSVKSPGFELVSFTTGAGHEPSDAEIMAIRRKWRDTYRALMDAARLHGIRTRDVTCGVACENWPMRWLKKGDLGLLRVGLNAVSMALGIDNSPKLR